MGSWRPGRLLKRLMDGYNLWPNFVTRRKGRRKRIQEANIETTFVCNNFDPKNNAFLSLSVETSNWKWSPLFEYAIQVGNSVPALVFPKQRGMSWIWHTWNKLFRAIEIDFNLSFKVLFQVVIFVLSFLYHRVFVFLYNPYIIKHCIYHQISYGVKSASLNAATVLL